MFDHILALLSVLFKGLEGEPTFTAAQNTITTRDPDAIEAFIAAHPESVVTVALKTSAGKAHALAFDCQTPEEADRVIAAHGEPALAIEDDAVSVVLIYRQNAPIEHVISDDDELLVESVPLPTSIWSLTELSVEKIIAQAEGEVQAPVETPAATVEPFKLNDAEFVGGDLPASVLDLPLKIGFGRSRDDKRWPAKAISFEQMLSMLTIHKEGEKDGPAFIQGEAIKNDRKARAISGLYVVGLDVDSGIKLDWVTHRIQHDLKLTSIIYTTHSHLSKQTLILQSSFQKYAKKRKLPLEPTSETMRQYMMDEKNWEKWVVEDRKSVV